jgi:phosphatidylserine/phosphatidylglycerophosphate/cardiolipin synthase-like enzyme
MPTTLRLVVNCDDAMLFWRVAAPIDGCLGFAIDREMKLEDGTVVRAVLQNRMGFKADEPKLGEQRSSDQWPFQRLWWADHEVNLGDTVRYRVCPVVRHPQTGALHRLLPEQSPWTPWATLSGGRRDGCAIFFNRALVISQFMARYLERLRVEQGLATRKQALAHFKAHLGEHDLPIRNFLAGALRDAMRALLAQALADGKRVFAALYELGDDELIQGLCALGARAEVVLANGSITPRPGETTAQARQRDQNQAARKALRDAGVVVHDRFVSPGALGHNKFLVVASATGKAQAAWTGSTNWTTTGLCTQSNNGLLVTRAAFAAEYLAQWKRLRDAGSAFPAALVAANGSEKAVTIGGTSAALWFTRTKGKVDLAALDAEVARAEQGVLFLMFQPGPSGTLKTIRDRAKADPGLYVRGVVSTLPPEAADGEAAVTVGLHGATAKPSTLDLSIVQPRGANAFAHWAATVARHEFLTMQGGVIGYAIVHSKLIVIDPFTRPVVITGSHNFSGNASTANDENFAVVRGNAELAASCAAHVMAVWDHYRWLALLGQTQAPAQPAARPLSGYLAEGDGWLAGKLRRSAPELKFWLPPG